MDEQALEYFGPQKQAVNINHVHVGIEQQVPKVLRTECLSSVVFMSLGPRSLTYQAKQHNIIPLYYLTVDKSVYLLILTR